jgi:ABC-type nitrate/sulfonate/bicarbonate transport system substrate-binding protein
MKARQRCKALCAVLIVGILAAFSVQSERALAETIRVGKAFPGVFDFTPIDIGLTQGFFAKHGIVIEEFDFNGSAKLQQALAADAIDVGLGSGPELAFVERGAPVKGVAAFMGPPADLVLFARNQPAVQKLADLKGKRVSVSTVGSLTAWLAQEFARQQGWGTNGIPVIALGAPAAQISALRDKQTDAMVTDLVKGTVFQQKNFGRIVLYFDKVAPAFITHVTYARDALIRDHPEALRNFLAAWFETIGYMRRHKDETVKVAVDVMHQPRDIVAKTYDVTMPAFSDTGRFEPKALAVLRRSFVEMGLLPTAPDMTNLYTEKFLPHGGGQVAGGPN